jgi:hypothetical protein
MAKTSSFLESLDDMVLLVIWGQSKAVGVLRDDGPNARCRGSASAVAWRQELERLSMQSTPKEE